eukprot:CAMPEP_0182856300 /NCGR_PEP_ID=MMETSP0034_2-20130328/2348_1 /TAXON_ID=156128 /ORGANISM="Nephroselmis pyriformis, Strain CCMP717" /LENGTH=148 /DNA_ID=CAMNT_0024987357 /DNA_START=1 /DNA_END=447 /DNA_ORIENTATION=+
MDAVLSVKESIATAQYHKDVKSIKIKARVSKLSKWTVAFAWGIMLYFIFVYGSKMYRRVGPGSERDFIVGWVRYLVIDNLLLGWSRAFKNVIATRIILLWAAFTGKLLSDPLRWFETFDDGTTKDMMDVDSADSADMFDDAEATEFFQ